MEGSEHALLAWISCRSGGDAVIEVAGELDLATAPLLERAFAEALDHGDRTVVVDLRDVGFIGSTGLSILLQARQDLLAADRALTLRCPSPTVARTLEITGLTSMFPVLDPAVEVPGPGQDRRMRQVEVL